MNPFWLSFGVAVLVFLSVYFSIAFFYEKISKRFQAIHKETTEKFHNLHSLKTEKRVFKEQLFIGVFLGGLIFFSSQLSNSSGLCRRCPRVFSGLEAPLLLPRKICLPQEDQCFFESNGGWTHPDGECLKIWLKSSPSNEALC